MTRSKELGELLSREEGKTLAEGVGEVYRSGQFFTYFAGEALRMLGESVDSVRAGVEVLMTREPLGVIGIISPWNFPLATASWKIAPALAFGNAVVWKPANITPASAWALTEMISRQALPKGLFSLLMGPGSAIGTELAARAEIQGLSFTGSGLVGAKIATAAAARFVKLQLEMGSKNPFVVMDDCDLDRAVDLAVNGAFGGTGQKCTAASRLVVHRPIHDRFVDRLLGKARVLRVGHALEEGVHLTRIQGHVKPRSRGQVPRVHQDVAEEERADGVLDGLAPDVRVRERLPRDLRIVERRLQCVTQRHPRADGIDLQFH